MTYYRNYQDGGKVEPPSVRNWFQKRYGAESGQVESLIKQIGTIESDNRDVVQVAEGGGEGPGRGFFQFEKTYKDPKTGKYGQASGLTARNRLARVYKDLMKEVPSWLSQEGMQDPEIGFDVLGLKPEQQEELLLANFAQNPLATEKLIKGALESGDAKDLWLQAHWAGKKEDKKEKSKYWDEKFQGMAGGGDVRGQNTDTVPAMLTPGEFVIRKDAADQIGPEKLHMLNNIDRLSNTALLENAKSPMGYQEGGKAGKRIVGITSDGKRYLTNYGKGAISVESASKKMVDQWVGEGRPGTPDDYLGYKNGGLVGMIGDFFKGQKDNWARARMMKRKLA